MTDAFRFEIRRLVLVDSAGFGYVEIPVDRHALLLGPGNLGKSSLLNALRLFLLPENNFRKSRLKFAFRNARAGGFYANEESFQHYFPSRFSFLVMEVSNPHGVHCQVLYRGRGDLEYDRLFVPLPYEALRGLFWRIDDDPDGIGGRVPELSAERVIDAARRASRDSLVTSDTARLRRLLYASDLMDRDASRYSVFPLADADSRKVESLRTLILLLFEMSTDDRAMAAAVASIVEADKKFASDELDFDIDQFLRRHEELKARDLELKRVEREQPRFDRLTRAYEAYRHGGEVRGDFAAFRKGLEECLASLVRERVDAAEAVAREDGALKRVRQRVKELEQASGEAQGALKAARRLREKADEDRRRGELLVSRYPGCSQAEIRAMLEEAIEGQTQQLAALQDAAQAEAQRARLAAQLQDVDVRLETLARRIAGEQWQLVRQLPETVVAPLMAVDPRLVQASPGEALDEATLASIVAFAGLFEAEPEAFRWFDTRFSARHSSPEDLLESRRHLQEERRRCERQLAELADDDAGIDRPRRIEETRRELEAAREEAQALKRFAGAETRLEDAEREITEQEGLLEGHRDKLAEAGRDADALQGFLARARGALARIDERQAELQRLRASATALQARSPQLAGIEAAEALAAESLTEARWQAIEAALHELDLQRLRVLDLLKDFVRAGVLPDDEGQLQHESPGAAVIRGACEQLGLLYRELPRHRELLQEQVASHNETVASYRQALRANAEHIQRFERRLNDELEGVTINDLAEIRVEIHCHPKFRNLVEESEAIDPYSGQLLSDAFYERLQGFVAEFFGETPGQGGHRLTMDRVITGISYRTRKQSETRLDAKGQSTSTTALINLELVQRLLRRILYPGVGLAFPMVLDELASVDVSQVPSLLERLGRQGFNLFAAATHSASPELIYQVGRHLEVGQMRTARPYSPRRSLVYWGGPEGFAGEGEVATWLGQEQASLLEVDDE
ncbi:hypothetical protein [Halomonas sp. BM-2019]|uniref:hypothetical protein n=1 Tax=Halomonas sp. BM-2019 TaxID=2811227 RepID=UPI001B3C2EC8|nr:MAG: hypothetical protein J5F18_11825 [Halomonas sp. BM-2019]